MLDDDSDSVGVPHHKRRSTDLPTNLYGFLADTARRHGPVIVILGFLVYAVVNLLQGATMQTKMAADQTLQELQKHEFETSWYQRQQCLSLAILAGTRAEMCEPPRR